MSSFAESLDRLWEIQSLDAAIIAADKAIALEERRLQDQQKQIERTNQRKFALEADLKQMQIKHREIEAELKRLDARISQIELVEGSGSEVEKHRGAIDALETEGLTLITEMPERRAEIEGTDAEIAALREKLAQMGQAADAVRSREQSIIDAKRAEREQIAAQVPEEMLKVYDHVAERHPGQAMCGVKGEFCAACSGELTMHLVQRSKLRAEFVRCPHCSRVLDARA
jgi:hypothetical protein